MLPLTRKENWLAKIAGDPQADENMIPRTREEYFLNEIAENGGGGGGGANVVRVTFTYDSDNDGVLADKTPAEVVAAWNGGAFVYGYCADLPDNEGSMATLQIAAEANCSFTVNNSGGFLIADGEGWISD